MPKLYVMVLDHIYIIQDMQSFAYDAYGYLAYALYNRTRLFNPVAK